MASPTLWVALALSACTPPVEAPADLGELTLYLYENFLGEGEDGPEALVAGLDSLETYLLTLDLEGDVDARAVTPPKLPVERLGGAVAPPTADVALQVPVAVSGVAMAPMDQQVEMILDTNQVCIAANSTAYHKQTFTSDASCFADRGCDRAEATQEFLINSLNDGWLDTTRQYVWVTMTDGREAIISREWMPQQAPSVDGKASWDQRYTLVAWIPEANGSGRVLRFYTMWSSITMTGVSDDLYATLVKDGLDEYFVNSDAFAAGEACDNDRDAPYTRE